MKQALKRIEATLQQLETVKAVSYPQPAAAKNVPIRLRSATPHNRKMLLKSH